MKPKSLYLHPEAKKHIRRPEQELQIAIFNYLRPLMVLQKYSQFMAFHVPNGGKRTSYEGYIFKAMGVMAGVTDIPFLFPGPKVVWAEVKVKGEDQTEPQRNFQARVEAFGFEYRLIEAKDASDAISQAQAILRANGVKI